MDRNKQGSSRSGKSKIGAPAQGSEIFALGSKSSSSSTSRDDVKSKVMSSSSSSGTKSSSVPERKREASTSLASNVSKKPKISTISGAASSSSGAASTSQSVLITPHPISRSDSSSSSFTPQELWEQIAQECDPADLVQSVLTAVERQDSSQVVALLCGAIKTLTSRTKPEPLLSLSLLYLAKLRPSMFCNDTVTAALLSILRRDSQHAFKGRNNPSTHILAANLLARGYHSKPQWPEKFVRHYIDDAINERVWVDYEDCSAFVENICTAFGTKVPPKSMLQPEITALGTNIALSREATDEDSSEGNGGAGSAELHRSTSDSHFSDSGPSRFEHIQPEIEKIVVEIVKEQLNRRQPQDSSTRNFLRFLATVSGLSEVRAIAITRLELWIHNGKLMKPAQELLTYICYNVTSHSARDHEVLSNMVKIRLKTKALINIYMNCIREMINLQPDILFIVLKNVVQNELSNSRNPNNLGMGMLASIFQAKPDESARHLAAIYQEFLLQRDDCLRTLRVFLRELVKTLRYDIKLTVFCQALLATTPSLVHQIENLDYRDRIFYSIVDLICLCMLLSVSPQIREANVMLRTGRELKGNKVLVEYYDQLSRIQCDAVKWMFETVPTQFKPSDTDYAQGLQKLLVFDAPENYSKSDQWPPEQERTLLLRLVAEIPLNQDTIFYIALIGMNKDIPFKIQTTVEIIEQVIRRAAALRIADYPALQANKLEMIDLFFTMAEYHHPENIALPVDYTPPKLAISNLYWKTWSVLLMLSAHNPSTFGAFCWERYPMLRNLMEMCITNQFSNYKMVDEELQVNALEKTQILEFETHLAAASKIVITEQNSLLLSQLILLDPMGLPRRPPPIILEMFQSLNSTLKLGHLLCRSRRPDLLLDIIQRQGTSQSMPWLADLVQNSEGDFSHLPVQCLCEFLLSNAGAMENQRDIELLNYLQNLLSDESADHQTSCEVLEYFLRRLASPSKQSRVNAIKGLQLLLKTVHNDNEVLQVGQDESEWLLHHLPMIPHFPSVRLIVIVQLRAACQIENNPELVMIYIQFIAANTLSDPLTEMLAHITDLSQLIVERNTLFACITPTLQTDENQIQTLNCLFVMFNNFLIKLREDKSSFAWSDHPDLVMIHFSDGNEHPIHMTIVHAFVILLTYATMIPNAGPILDYWFPINAPRLQASTMESSEPVQVLPDWLKLKMLRSPVDRLVDAALQDLTPEQIVLFIQNFGTPVGSMSKLLGLLDRAVIDQLDAVKACILSNATHLTQLIEIQQSRGAKNGHIALQSLQSSEEVKPDSPKQEIVVVESMNLTFGDITVPCNSSQTKEIEEIIDIILHNPSISSVNLARFRRLIQQMLTTDDQHHQAKQQQYTMSKIIQHLNRVAKSQQGQNFFHNMLENDKVCSFFRTLFESVIDKSSNYSYLVGIIDHCIQVMNTDNCPNLFQILFNKRKNYVKSSTSSRQIARQDLIQVIHTAPLMELQDKGKQMLSELTKRRVDTENAVDVIGTALRSSDTTVVKVENGGRGSALQSDKIGLLIDWLAELDSELIVSTRNGRLDLLFNQSLPQFRYYLLSFLSHQASWSTLHNITVELLQSYNESYDSTAVLHFISALIRNPKMWQGRDKGQPKHYSLDYVLSLDEKQVCTFTNYVLSESSVNPAMLNARVQMFLQCVPQEHRKLNALCEYVRQRANFDEGVKRRFLQQLYLSIPPMKFTVLDLDAVYFSDASSLTGCEVDRVTNNVMTAISSLSNSRDFQAMSFNLELLLRKMTASHPMLVLRQIPMLASLLQGRAHMDLHVLRNSYHIPLFVEVFGILELLQPHIFDSVYQAPLHQMLECYFALFHNHGTTKDTFNLMYRLMEFLQLYTQTDSVNALKFLEPHIDLIEDLAADNRIVVPLQQLVQGLSLLKYKQPNADDTKTTDASAVVLTPYMKTLNQNLTKLIAEIQKRTGDEVLAPLQELENVTTRRQVPLESIFERLLKLISSSSQSIRISAYTLLIRHLKSNPGNADINASTLAVYVQCLRDQDSAVALTALEFLTKMTICLQEYASEILRDVFEMGIKSKMNTFEQIRRCVLALKTQHAC